jgi:E3 ubiquitin-protein ligase HUWE1
LNLDFNLITVFISNKSLHVQKKLQLFKKLFLENNLPDGVDPSFLAALPDSIRQEVVAEQLRLQRIQQSARDQAQTAQNIGSMEVSPEFLAALPPGIQEEVHIYIL